MKALALLTSLLLLLCESQAFWARLPRSGAEAPPSIVVLLAAAAGDKKMTKDKANDALLDKDEDGEDNDNLLPRGDGLRKLLLSLNPDPVVSVGCTVIASGNIPDLGIWQFQSYELQGIYDQGSDPATGLVEKIPREYLRDKIPSGFMRYVTLYSPKHHQIEGPVVLAADEVGLSSVRDEVIDSVVMALPLFGFWTALAFSFANQYSARTGGSFLDAFFGR